MSLQTDFQKVLAQQALKSQKQLSDELRNDWAKLAYKFEKGSPALTQYFLKNGEELIQLAIKNHGSLFSQMNHGTGEFGKRLHEIIWGAPDPYEGLPQQHPEYQGKDKVPIIGDWLWPKITGWFVKHIEAFRRLEKIDYAIDVYINKGKQKMKLSEVKNLLREIAIEEMYPTHPDWEEPDGYSNEFQRAYAHSQATTPRKNETDKAKQLAKSGKYVVLATYPIFCKHTDAILGDETTIEKVFDNREEANQYGEKQSEASHGEVNYRVVGPEDLVPKPQPPPEPTSPDDDVPFQEAVDPSTQTILAYIQQHPELMKAMRDWVKDCQWGDVQDETDVDEFSDVQIIRGVQKFYEGGVRQFIADAEPQQQSDGVGPVYTKDIKKDPKHIDDPTTGKPERWRIKFQSANDIKKHGTTEKSPVNEGQLTDYIRQMLAGIKGETPEQKLERLRKAKSSLEKRANKRQAKQDIKNDQQLKLALQQSSKEQLKKYPDAMSKKRRIPKYPPVDPLFTSIKPSEPSAPIPFDPNAPFKKHEPYLGEISKGELKNVIKELVNEMWIGFQDEQEEQRDFMDHEKQESIKEVGDPEFRKGWVQATSDRSNNRPQLKNVKGLSRKYIEGYVAGWKAFAGQVKPQLPGKETQSDFGLGGPEKETQSDFGLTEVRMPRSQQTPKDAHQLWKLIDQLQYGQSINFYNPNNPNPNTTAPWVYVKKFLTHGGSGYEETGYNLSIEPRMDARPGNGVLKIHSKFDTGEDVTEDEVSLALEVVLENIDILSMYYIETEEAPPKRKPYQGDPDHDIGDYERFGPDEKRPDSSYVQNEEAPAGWEGTVKAMKKHKDIDNPWALAHWMKNKGMKSHK